MYIWREVSVDGEIYSLRETRSATKRGELISGETNQLQDGTLIDLCGVWFPCFLLLHQRHYFHFKATLLWRSAKGLQQSPSTEDLDRQLDELNAGLLIIRNEYYTFLATWFIFSTKLMFR